MTLLCEGCSSFFLFIKVRGTSSLLVRLNPIKVKGVDLNSSLIWAFQLSLYIIAQYYLEDATNFSLKEVCKIQVIACHGNCCHGCNNYDIICCMSIQMSEKLYQHTNVSHLRSVRYIGNVNFILLGFYLSLCIDNILFLIRFYIFVIFNLRLFPLWKLNLTWVIYFRIMECGVGKNLKD